jgi:hypothetical protein
MCEALGLADPAVPGRLATTLHGYALRGLESPVPLCASRSSRHDGHMSDAPQVGVGQVPAFTGLYPLFGGWGNWELLFTRHRLLTRAGGRLQEWVALSGQTRGRLLREDPLPVIQVSERRRYDRVLVDGRAFWIHRRHRATVRAWAAKPPD